MRDHYNKFKITPKFNEEGPNLIMKDYLNRMNEMSMIKIKIMIMIMITIMITVIMIDYSNN